jgi:hypothetical protein
MQIVAVKPQCWRKSACLFDPARPRLCRVVAGMVRPVTTAAVQNPMQDPEWVESRLKAYRLMAASYAEADAPQHSAAEALLEQVADEGLVRGNMLAFICSVHRA